MACSVQYVLFRLVLVPQEEEIIFFSFLIFISMYCRRLVFACVIVYDFPIKSGP